MARTYNIIRYDANGDYIEPPNPTYQTYESYSSPTPSGTEPTDPAIPTEQEGNYDIPDDPTPVQRSYLYGPVVIRLNSGGAFLVKNSSGQIVAKINDDGSIEAIGMVETVDSISE